MFRFMKRKGVRCAQIVIIQKQEKRKNIIRGSVRTAYGPTASCTQKLIHLAHQLTRFRLKHGNTFCRSLRTGPWNWAGTSFFALHRAVLQNQLSFQVLSKQKRFQVQRDIGEIKLIWADSLRAYLMRLSLCPDTTEIKRWDGGEWGQPSEKWNAHSLPIKPKHSMNRFRRKHFPDGRELMRAVVNQ